MARSGASIGWLATGALAVAAVAHDCGLMSRLALDQIALLSFGWLVLRLARWCGIDRRVAVPAAAGLLVALGVLRLASDDLRYMPYLLVVPINLAVAWLFASGLRGGREPILLRLIGLMGRQPAEDPGFRRFIARQCLLWAGLSLATAGLAAVALFCAVSYPWLPEVLAWLVGAQGAWFVLSHHYASLRYGRPEAWWTTARALLHPEIWSRLQTS